jgi:hypothetical protein
MSNVTNRLLLLLALCVCMAAAAGCGHSVVVVGRPASQQPVVEQRTTAEAPAQQSVAGKTEQPAAEAETKPEAKPEPETKPETKPEAKPGQDNTGAETQTVQPKTEAETPPPGASSQEPKPTVTQASSRRETGTQAGSAPYELDMSFGGFGLSQGLFDTPVAVAVDDNENIYVVDQGNYRVEKFDRFGIFQFAWGRQGLGDGEFEIDSSASPRTLKMTGIFEFNKPVGILLDKDDTRDLIRITVVDSLNHRIQRFLLTKFTGDTFPADVFQKLQEGGVNVPDTDLQDKYTLDRTQVILDPVYLNSQKADGTLLTAYIWGGLGFSQGLMNGPTWLAKDDSGMLYVSDTGNGRVQGFYVTPANPATDTTFYREFGNQMDKEYGKGRLNQPTAVAFDNTGYGSFLVLDEKPDGGFVIERFDRDGEFMSVFAESGGKPGQLRQPVAMAVSPFDNTVFITDRGHRKIMVYSNNGDFLFSFGGEELVDPRGIAILRNNYVYVTDAAKNMVYRYIPK